VYAASVSLFLGWLMMSYTLIGGVFTHKGTQISLTIRAITEEKPDLKLAVSFFKISNSSFTKTAKQNDTVWSGINPALLPKKIYLPYNKLIHNVLC